MDLEDSFEGGVEKVFLRLVRVLEDDLVLASAHVQNWGAARRGRGRKKSERSYGQARGRTHSSKNSLKRLASMVADMTTILSSLGGLSGSCSAASPCSGCFPLCMAFHLATLAFRRTWMSLRKPMSMSVRRLRSWASSRTTTS